MKESYKRILKKVLGLILVSGIITMLIAPSALAATTLLPQAGDDGYCQTIFKHGDPDLIEETFQNNTDQWEPLLGCALKYGTIEFWMLKFYVLYALEFIISLAGLLAILMLIVGAYFYIAGGLTDDKEKGKTVIKYALGGLVLTTLSWIIINVILLALTN